VLDHLAQGFGFSGKGRVLKHYPEIRVRKPAAREAGPLKVLWAGRFTRQKKPDVLAKVAERCPEHEFHLYCTNPDNADVIGRFEDLHYLPNVVARGPFESFEDVKPDEYDVLLYTSGWDGMPNVILEAIASGIPVIAPAIGGIPEVIDSRSGFLVSDPDAVSEYVAYLHSIYSDPIDALAKARIAQTRLLFERNSSTFLESWSGILGQLLGAREGHADAVALPLK
jgi:glycosyltransferase involved in cell wall biosynthesis